MSVRVGELVSQLRSRSHVTDVMMKDVELVTDGPQTGFLRVGDNYLPWVGADRNLQAVASFLGGPGYKYYTREDLEWQARVVRHHVDKMADLVATWYFDGNTIEGVYQPDAKVLPLVRIAEQIADVFSADDRAEVLHAPDQVEINIVSDLRTVTVPGIPGIASRPMDGMVDHPLGRKVGDLSAGGVRVITHPAKPERAPIVEEHWFRYVCTNSLVRRITGSQINLRGRTVDEILEEMNRIMRVIWDGLDGSAQAIRHSAETPIPGAVSDFIRQVARERKINPPTVLALQDRAATLPPNPTVYDVTQIFTEMANKEGLPVGTRRDLQAIGGDLTIDTARMIHRCTQCERPLEGIPVPV